MAREVILRDDLDGSLEDVETVTISHNGRTVEVDLSSANRARLAELLDPYMRAGRRPSRPASSGRTRPSRKQAERNRAIRAWAASVGLSVPNRGPIPADVAERYDREVGQ